MTPDEDNELDQWLEGLAGKAEPRAGTGFDELDARLAHDMRTLDRQWQEEVTDLDVARAWSKIKPSAPHRVFAFPFASGIAAGALLALGSTLVFQTLRQAEPDLGYKGPDASLPTEATWSAELISSDPTTQVMELVMLLERTNLAFTLGFDSNVYTVEWRHSGVSPTGALAQWLRTKGIVVPADTEQVVLRILPRAPE